MKTAYALFGNKSADEPQNDILKKNCNYRTCIYIGIVQRKSVFQLRCSQSVHRHIDLSSGATQRSPVGHTTTVGEREPYSSMPFSATLDPLLVHFPPARPRPPTLRECQSIVRYLQQVCDRQAHEVGITNFSLF